MCTYIVYDMLQHTGMYLWSNMVGASQTQFGAVLPDRHSIGCRFGVSLDAVCTT